ncbi:MAG: PBP1A family penicillin-binding protein [Firmicutes bacterium]|nr:PBP1A family penicillin-binding protein [Bacillota bacterium]
MAGVFSGRKRRLLVISVFIFSILVGAGFGILAGFLKSAPSLSEVEFAPKLTSYVYDTNGEVLTRLYKEHRVKVELEQMPLYLRQAVLAAEDDGFYQHYGIDFTAIARAILADIRARAKVQGASTITQQLARTAFLTQKKLWSRKLQEVLWAIQIERKYSKDEIFETYLNLVNFGHGTYGVQAAADLYFGKDVQDLTLPEAALLATVPNSPVYLSPISYPDAALRRRNWILGRMAYLGYISEKEAEAARQTPIQLVQREPKEKIASYFIDYVVQQLLERYGEELVFGGGLEIHTSLDMNMQRVAEEELIKGLPTGPIDKNGLQQPQGALVAIETETGLIRTMVGGRGDDKFNRAVLARRQPGSGMKPFIYTAAIEQGFTPATVIVDEPVEYVMASGEKWAPQNYHRDHRGPLTLRDALRDSINIVAVKLLDQVGIRNVVDLTKRMGITTLVEEGRYNDLGLAPLALGGLTRGTTVLEMASAYGVFANQGVWVAPTAITKVVDSKGNVLEAYKPEHRQVIAEQTAYLMNDMLRDVIENGTGKQAKIDRPAAGKTGTAQSYTNGWFVGYTPSLVTAVWMGDDEQNQEMVYKGVRYGSWDTARIWGSFMQRALANKPVEDFAKPDGIVDNILIDVKTGLLARQNGLVPEEELRYESFIEGTEPKEYSPRAKTLIDHLKDIFLGQPDKEDSKSPIDDGRTPLLDSEPPKLPTDKKDEQQVEPEFDLEKQPSQVEPVPEPDTGPTLDEKMDLPKTDYKDPAGAEEDSQKALQELKDAFGL